MRAIVGRRTSARGTARAPRAAIDFLHADMFDAAGARRGRVRLTAGSSSDGSLVISNLSGLDAGLYGIQVHAAGSCSGAGFGGSGPRMSNIDLADLTSAGGAEGPQSFNLTTADLPALQSLLQGDGASVVVHAKPSNHGNIPDRYTADGAGSSGPDASTQSTGDAGAGIICGTLRTVPLVERYIDAVYGYVLGRTVEPAGTAAWADYLAGHSRAGFASGVAGTLEARRRLVRSMYLVHFDAEPDPPGLAFWADRLARPGFTEDALIVSFLTSDRFYAAAGGTNRSFAEEVLRRRLLRAPSAGELGLWTAYLDGGGSRWTMASSIVKLDESRSHTIRIEYVAIIGRDPNLAEIAVWFAYFRRGGQAVSLRSFLLGSDDFYRLSIESPFGFT